MASLNSVTLIGNLTQQPEVKFIPSGKAVCNFSIAMNHKWKTDSGELKEDVTFAGVVIFGRAAEALAQYCHRGSSVLVLGRLKQESWVDKTTNEKRNKLIILAESVQFLDGKKDSGEKPSEQKQESSRAKSASKTDPDLDADGPDIPF